MKHLPHSIIRGEGGKIALLVIDGLGGLPHRERGLTELEEAHLPNLDDLARRSSLGRVRLLPAGLTPGSGPGHLSLFGYDPLELEFGRGLLEALGSDYPLRVGEVAARGNFCTLDASGVVVDRRAGRPSTEECRRLVGALEKGVSLAGAKLTLLPGKEHRFTAVLGPSGLGARVNDNDPQVEGKRPIEFRGEDAASERTAALANDLFAQARKVLAAERGANGVLLRGFSTRPEVETYDERYRLRAAALAIYPMYRGVARLAGMTVEDAGKDLADQIRRAKELAERYDFIFIHTKAADTAGHSGDFAAKIAALEEIDAHIPALEAIGFDALAITGDHSTPCVHREHSWHPVPLLIRSERSIPVEGTTFDERGVLRGDLGTIRGPELLPLLLAHAGRLDKFGA